METRIHDKFEKLEKRIKSLEKRLKQLESIKCTTEHHYHYTQPPYPQFEGPDRLDPLQPQCIKPARQI